MTRDQRKCLLRTRRYQYGDTRWNGGREVRRAQNRAGPKPGQQPETPAPFQEYEVTGPSLIGGRDSGYFHTAGIRVPERCTT